MDCSKPFPSWKRQFFVLIEVDNYSGYGFAFPAGSAKIVMNELTKCRIHHNGTYTVLLLTKELSSQSKKYNSGHIIMESTGFSISPHHSEAAGLIKNVVAF
jgi:hypothetical protein